MKSAWNEKGTRVLLGVVAGLLGLNLLVGGLVGSPRTAVAQLPDSGAQLEKVVGELTKLNKTVEKMQALLESGKMTVKVDAPAEKKGK